MADTSIKAAAATAIADNCPKLTSLNVFWCDKLTDASIPKLTDAFIAAVADNCHNLTSLNISGCDKLTDAFITAYSNHCPNTVFTFVF